MRQIYLLLTALCLACTSAKAQPGGPAPDAKRLINAEITNDILNWLNQDVVRLMIKSQNERHAKLNQAGIIALDKQWRAERKLPDQPLISATLSNPLSVYLSRMQGQSLGLYSEIFITDNKGLNVGQSSITSDFWQGDEAKFQKTFPKGVGASFVDDAEWDDKFRVWKAQLNITISDASGTTPIGAATIEINLTELARRQTLTN
jgi:hypothetical protein